MAVRRLRWGGRRGAVLIFNGRPILLDRFHCGFKRFLPLRLKQEYASLRTNQCAARLNAKSAAARLALCEDSVFQLFSDLLVAERRALKRLTEVEIALDLQRAAWARIWRAGRLVAKVRKV